MDEEEGMVYEEAVDATVDRRKFLINRIFQPRQDRRRREGGGGRRGRQRHEENKES